MTTQKMMTILGDEFSIRTITAENETLFAVADLAAPLGLSNSREMFSALVEILSLTENKTEVYNHFSDLIEDLYN